jgi:hypothetical protein
MSRNRAVIVAIAVLIVVVAFGVIVYTQVGRGGGQARSVDVNVSGTTMTPDRINVRQNDQVTMNVTADRKEEIHIHGYDIAFEVGAAGDTVQRTFKADRTGTFEIEIEDTGIPLGELVVSP